ncbi:MAG: hypothetical protein JNK58_03980 [Phycisphaerae bacterium]|nr:hypothetical protein [Phycisphaerae bacterium]
MNRYFLAGIFLMMCGYLASECCAAPEIDQIPPGPISYVITDVSDTEHPSTYDITVAPISDDCDNDPTFCISGFTIRRSDELPNEAITIHKLTIVRPPVDGDQITVSVGGSGTGINGPFKAVQEIYADPRDAGNQEGFVWVRADLFGTANTVALGTVSGPNTFIAVVGQGDVGGPISCVMHPRSDPDEQIQPNYFSIISLSGNGNMLADVTMESWSGTTPKLGVISQVQFQLGVIGNVNDKVNIHADGVIDQVIAKEIHANIAGTDIAPNDSYVDLLGLVNATKFNGAGTGNFTGEIRAEILGNTFGETSRAGQENVRIEGQMNGRIWLQSIEGTTLNDAYGIAIPKTTPSLLGTIAIAVLDQGSYVWGSSIEVLPDSPPQNQIRLTGSGTGNDVAGYDPSRTAASLGGGAVGVVPFRLHGYDCFPVAGSTLTDLGARPGPGVPIQMRHYGLVNWDEEDEETGDPFKIERRRAGSSNSWTDESGCFTQELDTNATIVDLEPSVPLQRGFEYRVSRLTRGDGSNILRSDVPHLDVTADPEVYDYEPLTFTICESAADGDADDNGCVNFADVTNVLENFSLTVCLKYGDADRDGDVDFADLTPVLANFNAAPCGTCSAGLTARKGDGFHTMDAEGEMTAAGAVVAMGNALASMGYASISDFVDAITQMGEEERNAEIRRLGELLQGTP